MDWIADKNVRITSNDITENKAASVCVPAENTDVVQGAAQGLRHSGLDNESLTVSPAQPKQAQSRAKLLMTID